jgi:hypothetical protein
MCICCGEIEVSEALGLCVGCAIDLRAEVVFGIHRFEVYLDGWAAYGEWLAGRGGGLAGE